MEYRADLATDEWRQLTNRVVFDELWSRPGLSPRDRSIATLSWLFGSGRGAAATKHHIRRGLTNGLTLAEIHELAVHTAFYAGWPCGSPAIALVAEVAAEIESEERDA